MTTAAGRKNTASSVIEAREIAKTYRLYESPTDRVKEAFHPCRKKYHRYYSALNGISFTVGRGEALGIIGRNGSGKSTLLQVLCGVLQPSSGEVRVKGRISALLELGAGFNPDFTGRENVFMNTAIMGMDEAATRNRFEFIENFADIGEYIDQPVKTYSSGMYVRLAFATAISVDPEVLIVDEALAVGDIFFQQKCMEYMKGIMDRCTVVFVTHDMPAVTAFCDRVIVLDKGRITFDGPPGDGVAQYTKIVHNERFRAAKMVAAGEENAACAATVADHGWTDVPESARGGRQEVVIVKARLLDRDGSLLAAAVPDDGITVEMLVRTPDPKENIIFGYTVKDRTGKPLFGQNSFLLGGCTLAPGNSLVRFTFRWPEIYPEEYTVTLGVGEGMDPFVHTIQCWAHNILLVKALTPDKRLHGLFDGDLFGLQVCAVELDGRRT